MPNIVSHRRYLDYCHKISCNSKCFFFQSNQIFWWCRLILQTYSRNDEEFHFCASAIKVWGKQKVRTWFTLVLSFISASFSHFHVFKIIAILIFKFPSGYHLSFCFLNFFAKIQGFLLSNRCSPQGVSGLNSQLSGGPNCGYQSKRVATDCLSQEQNRNKDQVLHQTTFQASNENLPGVVACICCSWRLGSWSHWVCEPGYFC